MVCADLVSRDDISKRQECPRGAHWPYQLRELSLLSATLASVLLAAIFTTGAAGGRVVVTNSIPRGLYWTSNESISRGSIAGGCLPLKVVRSLIAKRYALHGNCPGHVLPYFKYVAAVAGDTVIESSNGILINGRFWPRSRPLSRDSNGAPLIWTSHKYIVNRGQVLLLGSNPRSYDGRYFGAVPLAGMTSMQPVLVEPYAFQ